MSQARSGSVALGLRVSSALAGLGDGLAATALPLLAAGLTRDPLSVATVVAAQHLPWVVVALLGRRALARADSSTVVGGIDSLRAAALGVLGYSALTDGETILAVQVVALLVGLGDALTDDVEDLLAGPPARRAGASEGGRRRPGGLVGLALFGLPLGGFLYGLLSALPFLAGVLPYAMAGLLVLLTSSPGPPSQRTDRRRPVVPALVPGTLPLTGVAAAATAANSAVLGVLVLFAVADLGLGAPAFGMLLAALAGAAVAGSLLAPEIGRVLGPRRALPITLAVSGSSYIVAALVADPGFPIVAVVFLALASGAAMVGGVVLRALLHAAADRTIDEPGLRAFHAVVWAAIPVGALGGGLAARAVGVGGLVLCAGGAGLAVAVVATGSWAAGGSSAQGRRRPASAASSAVRRRPRPEQARSPRPRPGARNAVAGAGRSEFSRNSVDARP